MILDSPSMTTSDNERLRHEYELYARRKQELAIKARLTSNDVIDVDVTSLVDSFKVKAQLEAATTTGQSGGVKSGR
ncbi:TPA: hypothetical protein ACMDXF_000939 [Vibrio parahaemolyticus]|uniref:Uncharacterized protein n=1 Tax=Vibrio proteolyticus NBRC 13287 TaxID=1219065 RepID=U2ZHE0_VIBPR|nr:MULTISPECIES: hypothetical protein [Vibrio harveyi group]MDW1969471.1 hypothetical protein [Vibrio sp. 945]GAD67106.1 hypothetical protein VPR01S_06_01230 [Vibrio proteolyticus NBRC 13287]EGQ9442999.1 hypothetical protein [Vibrio parahaemolyticus]EGR2203728.1 hypothetical protein [Vibrio parahaemolyticus]EGR3402344.1 hypothetical protein [Vibrio parahaemolyticus]